MSGIIPPSIVTYEYPLDFSSSKYVSVSFPFRVKINKVWFTTDANALNGWEGATFESGRTLKLAAAKVKNRRPREGAPAYENPSDLTNFFGSTTEKPYFMEADQALKPTMFLGNPDSAPEGQITQTVGYGTLTFRSTAENAPELNNPANIGWINQSWLGDPVAFSNNSYKTDLSIMHTDESLVMFAYNSDGDWSGYVNGSAMITIHVAYTGMSFEEAQSAPKPQWTPWIED